MCLIKNNNYLFLTKVQSNDVDTKEKKIPNTIKDINKKKLLYLSFPR